MAAKKQESLFWRILISAVGAALIFMSVSNLLLFFLGETATAAVETRRYGGERFNAPNDKRYSWYVDYTFRAEDGVLYEGHLSKLGSATSVKVDNTIYYFPFAPFINTTAETAAPNFGQLVLFGAGVVLIAAVNQRRRPRRTKAVAPRARTLTDYDDSVESTFYEEVEMSNFCTSCGAPLEADARFCTACGTPVAPPIPPQAPPQQQVYQAAQQQVYQAAPQPAYQAPRNSRRTRPRSSNLAGDMHHWSAGHSATWTRRSSPALRRTRRLPGRLRSSWQLLSRSGSRSPALLWTICQSRKL